MKLLTALNRTVLSQATVVAGKSGLERSIGWVQVVDHPEILQWLKSGQLLLTTGYSWPREPDECRVLLTKMSNLGLVGVVLAVPHFLEHFPEAAVEEANNLGFPLLEISWDIPFSQISQEILEAIISFQDEAIRRADQIHRALTIAASQSDAFTALAKALHQGLTSRVIILSSAGDIWGSAGDWDHGEIESLLCHFGSSESYSGSKDALFPFIEKPQDDTLNYLGLPIASQGRTTGVVWLSEPNILTSELARRALEHAVVVAALHVTHQQELIEQENRLGYALISALLEGKLPDNPSSLARAAMSGWRQDEYYKVGMILLDEPVPMNLDGLRRRQDCAENIKSVMAEFGYPTMMSISLNQISIVMPQALDHAKLWHALCLPKAAMAVSRDHKGIVGMQEAAADVAALLAGLRPGRIHTFDEVLFPRALLGDPAARKMLVDKYVTSLGATKNGALLLDTLICLAGQGYHLVATASALDIHISTLRYRLAKIEAILGSTFEDTEFRFRVQVACELYKIQADAEQS